ncbi:type II toxin-antitoxin system VapB family antitoxin [Herbiconiux sp. UC225_62]|uniref:type II toxin-antitoxin system VapB family antitoxin n=1 Tax=Herbiconiux sp. UC225_62 TaxID=3350168 RepID=UPI0036D2F6B7
MVVTSIDIDPGDLQAARRLVGATSNKETVAVALKTLIASRRQSAVIESIIAHRFEDDQIDAPTITPAGQHSAAS